MQKKITAHKVFISSHQSMRFAGKTAMAIWWKCVYCILGTGQTTFKIYVSSGLERASLGFGFQLGRLVWLSPVSSFFDPLSDSPKPPAGPFLASTLPAVQSNSPVNKPLTKHNMEAVKALYLRHRILGRRVCCVNSCDNELCHWALCCRHCWCYPCRFSFFQFLGWFILCWRQYWRGWTISLEPIGQPDKDRG